MSPPCDDIVNYIEIQTDILSLQKGGFQQISDAQFQALGNRAAAKLLLNCTRIKYFRMFDFANVLTSDVFRMESLVTKIFIGGHVNKHVVAGTFVGKAIFFPSGEGCEPAVRCITAIVYL